MLAVSWGKSGYLMLPVGVKGAPPLVFKGAIDGDSVINSIQQLDNYFDLIQLLNNTLRARYAVNLCIQPAYTWYAMQKCYLMTLTWANMSRDLQIAFRFAGFAKKAIVQLSMTRITNSNIMEFVAQSNISHYCCMDVSKQETQFLYEYGFWAEVQA